MNKLTYLFLLFPLMGLFGQNIGINTNAPQAKLHLNGNLKFEPKLTVDATRLVGVTFTGNAKEFALGDTFNITNGTLEITESVDPNVL